MRIFRLYVLISLTVSLFYIMPVANSVSFTTNGYHLAILEVKFYCLLLLFYSFRPSRFKSIILSSYNEDEAPALAKEKFFWMVYLITLLILFGVPLLLCYGYIMGILGLMHGSNQYILGHAGAFIPALFFLTLSCCRLWKDRQRSINEAKLSVARTIYALVVTGVVGLMLYLALLICRIEPNGVIIFCLAFNAALLWTDYKIFIKTRPTNG